MIGCKYGEFQYVLKSGAMCCFNTLYGGVVEGSMCVNLGFFPQNMMVVQFLFYSQHLLCKRLFI